MRLMLDISGVTFSVARSPEPKTDFASKRQRTERGTNEPLWVVHLVAMDPQDTEIIKVTVAGEEPKLTQGQSVHLVGLEAIPWVQDTRHGVAYRAERITPAVQNKAASA